MKKKLSILAVLLLAVAISAYSVGGTYAKYTTTANVTGSAPVAKWAFEVTANGEAVGTENFDLSTTIYDTNGDAAETDVAEGYIAPGTYGSFDVELDGTGTQVSYTYGVTFTLGDAVPTNIKFYSDEDRQQEIEPVNGVYTAASGTVLVGGTQVNGATIYWMWDYETTDGDADDTADGEAAEPMLVNISFTATQAD